VARGFVLGPLTRGRGLNSIPKPIQSTLGKLDQKPAPYLKSLGEDSSQRAKPFNDFRKLNELSTTKLSNFEAKFLSNSLQTIDFCYTPNIRPISAMAKRGRASTCRAIPPAFRGMGGWGAWGSAVYLQYTYSRPTRGGTYVQARRPKERYTPLLWPHKLG